MQRVQRWFVLVLLVCGGGAWAQSLRVSTFNIRWYGQGNEKRDPHIRKALAEEIDRSDVISFQEIVDVRRLEKNIIQGRMNCQTYETPNKNHQHVVWCYKKKYKFERESGDDNYEIESVAYSHGMRPALYGLLKSKSGKAIAHLMGVHLKAMPDKTENRLFQAEKMAEVIDGFNDTHPVIITGDFNTFDSETTNYHADDAELIEDIFDDFGLGLSEVKQHGITFVSNKYRNKFDRFWVSDSLQIKEAPEVARPCGDVENTSKKAISDYNKKVSDHCLVSVTVSTK